MNKLKIFLTLTFISFSLSNLIAQKTDGIHSIVIFEFKGNGIIDYSEQSTPLIPTQSTPVNFIKNFLDFPLDSY